MSREEVKKLKNFLNRIAEVRKSKGISQESLAKSLNTYQQQVSKYEKNINLPSVEKLVEIALILDCTLDDLIEVKKSHEIFSNKINKL